MLGRPNILVIVSEDMVCHSVLFYLPLASRLIFAHTPRPSPLKRGEGSKGKDVGKDEGFTPGAMTIYLLGRCTDFGGSI